MSETVVLIAFGSVALVMALVSGVFLGFSDFIMRSLRVSSPRAGIEAMQQINREVLSSAFVFSLLARRGGSASFADWATSSRAARGGCSFSAAGCFSPSLV